MTVAGAGAAGPAPEGPGSDAVRRGAIGYEPRRRRSVWQSIVPRRYPTSIASVRTEQDAVDAVLAARGSGRPVCVISSGHSYLGDALQDGTALLDLTSWRRIAVDPARGTARVGPAVTNGELDAALEAVDRAFPVGHSPSVAVGGYLLGGGLGWNPDGWGTAACGHVLGATVLLADGSIVRTAADAHPDLFFALRGAGPCFPGVVLEYEVELLPRPRAISELVARYPISHVAAVAGWVGRAAAEKSSAVELAVMLVGPSAANGPEVVVTATAFAADSASAAAALDPIDASLPRGGAASVRPRTLAAMLRDNDAPPQRYDVEGVWTSDPEAAILAASHGFHSCPAPDSLVHVSVRSGPTAPADSAFSITASTFVFSSAVWDDAGQDTAVLAWQDGLTDRLQPGAVGRYVNETDYVRHPGHLRESFTPASWRRIEHAQTVYDPSNVFDVPNRRGART